jgi:hypothetical protein
MKKLIILLILFLTSCAPSAEFSNINVNSYYPIYGTYFTKDVLPPADDDLAEGESYVYYWGIIERKMRRGGVTYIRIERDDYFYYAAVEGKMELDNGSTCYMYKVKEEGEVNSYFVSEGKKYKME